MIYENIFIIVYFPYVESISSRIKIWLVVSCTAVVELISQEFLNEPYFQGHPFLNKFEPSIPAWEHHSDTLDHAISPSLIWYGANNWLLKHANMSHLASLRYSLDRIYQISLNFNEYDITNWYRTIQNGIPIKFLLVLFNHLHCESHGVS